MICPEMDQEVEPRSNYQSPQKKGALRSGFGGSYLLGCLKV
jgi:hypothetical protein